MPISYTQVQMHSSKGVFEDEYCRPMLKREYICIYWMLGDYTSVFQLAWREPTLSC